MKRIEAEIRRPRVAGRQRVCATGSISQYRGRPEVVPRLPT
jgi:hypothetical protein